MYGVASGFSPIFRLQTTDAVDMMMDTYDIDKNGSLNVDEAAAIPIMSKANFEVVDTYGDDQVSREEFVSYIDQMKQDVAGGLTANPFVSFMSGAEITIDTFAEIDAEVNNQSGKETFINYIQHLTEKYETAQRAAANGEEVETEKSSLSESLSTLV
ncbi:hypothetical protein [Cohaesibacter celericrescens]|uniref:EF-hand domain-containing protein n=1 Tax=Cohaesibacter celericrescens TaxID=2067669 RepID=A0A2N5XKN6_9HYPH|nr:hypothetical protein [Cohaesibacter celericrescens]PLW75054.1 hypothetical protein C0081_22420 [Cohaesibacter celericrescens]